MLVDRLGDKVKQVLLQHNSNYPLNMTFNDIDTDLKSILVDSISAVLKEYTEGLFSIKNIQVTNDIKLQYGYEYVTFYCKSEFLDIEFFYCSSSVFISELLKNINISLPEHLSDILSIYKSIPTGLQDRIKIVTDESYKDEPNKLIIVLNEDIDESLLSNLTEETISNMTLVQSKFSSLYNIQDIKKISYNNRTFYVAIDQTMSFSEEHPCLVDQEVYCQDEDKLYTSDTETDIETIQNVIAKYNLMST